MRIPSGTTDQYIYFVAVDSTDLKTRETGLSSFTVYRSRNGAAAAAMTTPTINETDSTNMPGVYELLLDEDMTIGSGNDSEAMTFHVTATGMAPVTLQVELYRPKITAGNTLGVESDGDLTKVNTVDGHTAQTGDSYAVVSSGTHGNSALKTLIDAVDTVVDAIKVTTDNLPNSGALNDLATLASRLTAARAGYLDNLNGRTAQTGDNYARIGAPAGASVSADIAAIEAQTDDIGAAGAGLTAVPWNASWDAEVQSEVADALAAYNAVATTDLPTNFSDLAITVTTGRVTVGTNNDKAGYSISGTITTLDGLNNLSAADVNAECDTALADYDPPTKAELDSGFAALNDPTANAIADQVWTEAIADHSGTSGSTAEALNAAGSAGDPWTTALPGAYGAGSAGHIVGNLNDISASDVWSAGTRTLTDKTGFELASDGLDSVTLPANLITAGSIAASALNGKGDWNTATPLTASGIRSAVGLASANLDTQIGTLATASSLSTLDGKVDDIAGATFDTATDSLEALRNRGDAAWLTATGFSTHSAADVRSEIDSNSTQLAAIVADTDELQTNQGNWLTATGFSTHAAADVWSVGVRSLTDKAGFTISGTITTLDALDAAQDSQHGTTQAAVAALNNLSAADVNAELDTALADYDAPTKAELDAGLAALNDPTATAIADAVWTETIADHSGTSGSTAEALDNAGGGLTAGAIADAVWTETLADHSGTSGSTAEKLDSLSTGSGSGAYSATITVTDGSSPLENATVRIVEGANQFTVTTDASGNGTFSVDAATYTVTVTKDGYSFTATTRTVTGNEAGTLVSSDLEMTAISGPGTPSDPSLCRVTGTFIGLDGAAVANARIEFELVQVTAAKDGTNILHGRKFEATTNASGALEDKSGNAYLDLVRTDSLTPTGAYYRVNAPKLGFRRTKLELDAASYTLDTLIT